MTYVALAALVALIATLYFSDRDKKALNTVLKEANERETQTRTQLLSVLGKTETVALSFNDKRPAHPVTYVDDALEIELERAVER